MEGKIKEEIQSKRNILIFLKKVKSEVENCLTKKKERQKDRSVVVQTNPKENKQRSNGDLGPSLLVKFKTYLRMRILELEAILFIFNQNLATTI